MSSDFASSVDVPQWIQDVLSLYKIPLIFLFLGFVFMGGAGAWLWSTSVDPSPVSFQTQETSTVSAMLRVDVSGAVKSPGVYSLPVQSRVEDAMTLAGGLSKDADTEWIAKNLNKAAKLVDGGKLYIPSKQEKAVPHVAGVQTSSSSVSDLVNINTANMNELDDLPGVGETTAKKILAGRPYQTIEELKSKKIVGNAVYGKIKDRITL